MASIVELTVGYIFEDVDMVRTYYGTISLWGIVIWQSQESLEANHLAVDSARDRLLEVMRELLISRDVNMVHVPMGRIQDMIDILENDHIAWPNAGMRVLEMLKAALSV